MTNTAKVAIIEDNKDLREELAFFLQSKGHQVWGQGSAENFWKQLHSQPVDIVLIDLGLPGEDGFSVIEYLKTLGHYGLIVMTARGGRDDRLRGLSLGADYYMVKPVNFADLAEAIAALWRRIQQESATPPASADTKSQGSWVLEGQTLCSPNGKQLALTSQEFKLIDALYRNRNEVCNKEMLHDLLFGYDAEPDTHRIDVILNRLRTKARQHAIQLPVRAVFGKGLVLLNPDP